MRREIESSLVGKSRSLRSSYRFLMLRPAIVGALVIAITSLFYVGTSNATSLPNCPKYKKHRWHNCVGVLSQADASYTGAFRRGVPHGRGKMVWPDGETYDGDFVKGQRSGYGEWKHPGGDVYRGQFKGNVFHGQGSYMFPDGRKHTGGYERGQKHGQGTFTWPDGRKYLGNFRDNKFHGFGKLLLLDGNSYLGTFKGGLQDGKGKIVSQNGSIIEEGVWKNGVLVKSMRPLVLANKESVRKDALIQKHTHYSKKALLIANSDYKNTARLENPSRDVDLLEETLEQAGFVEVVVHKNLGRYRLLNALKDFAVKARTADVAVVYYAGHAIQMNGQNYLIPIDATLQRDSDIGFETVSASLILTAIEGAKKLKIMILDACRNNPFANKMVRSVATRSISRGLAEVETAKGEYIAYATRAGQVALDGVGDNVKNSPFAVSLARRISQHPPLGLRRMFDYVRDDVMRMTQNQQQPFYYGSLPADLDFYFNK